MNYLTRPVFLLKPNWAEAISRQVTFDLREMDLGYGAPFFTPTEEWTVNAWQFEVMLATADEVADMDAFTAALVGPLNGFWLPAPFTAARILAGTDTTHFTIAGEQLNTFWNDRPDQHLFFTFTDGTQAAAKIQSVVVDGVNETVTLTTALPQVPDANTQAKKLLYVRLADDAESGEFLAEDLQARQIGVVELPQEYAAAQTGLQPIYLFHFWANAPIGLHWRYTSFAAPVVSDGQVFSNWPIDFDGLMQSSDGSSDDLRIKARPDDAHPFALFFPVCFTGTLYVEVFVIDYSALDAQTLLFSGRVVSVEDIGTDYEAVCESRLGFLKRKVPRYLKGQNCQNILFDPATCKAPRAIVETTVNIFSVGIGYPPTVVCTFVFPVFAAKFQAANYLANGIFEAGLGINYEARSIVASSYDAGSSQLTLTLNVPLIKTAGGQAQIVAGCDHTAATCQTKFNNYVNFNGFVAIPPRNPTLKAINANSVSQGGK